jgi:Fe-S-cluster-containing dehydrogenase component
MKMFLIADLKHCVNCPLCKFLCWRTSEVDHAPVVIALLQLRRHKLDSVGYRKKKDVKLGGGQYIWEELGVNMIKIYCMKVSYI